MSELLVQPGIRQRQNFQTTSPLKPWSRFLPNFLYSIDRPGDRKSVFLSRSDKDAGGNDNLHLQYTHNGEVKIDIYCCLIANILTNVLLKCSLGTPCRRCD